MNIYGKLISTKMCAGLRVETYKIPVIAGMQFDYKGSTTKNKLNIIGYYTNKLYWNDIGEIVKEVKSKIKLNV